MPSKSTAAPLTFDVFWRWLAEHRNCVVRVTAGDASLLDNELVHWDFFEDEDNRAVCQAIVGKSLVGEVVVERAEVLFVQSTPDAENPSSGYWTFELIGGPRDDSYPLYSFTLTHGMEGAQGHQLLKH